MQSVLILGGGPAGCQCALWLKMLGLNPIIIERRDKLGGLQTNNPYINEWMAGYPGVTGLTYAEQLQKQIQDHKIKSYLQTTISDLRVQDHGVTVSVNDEKLSSPFFVLATGVHPRCGDFVATEQVLIGPGNAVYQYPFQNKRVAIFGGGDNAAENYAFISQKNPVLCHVYARTIKARPALWRQIKPENIFVTPYEIDQSFMRVLVNKQFYEYDVFVVLYGWEANIPCALRFYRQKLLTENGFIKTDKHCRTPITSIFAIGEVANRAHPCVSTAMADGVIAAKAIESLLLS